MQTLPKPGAALVVVSLLFMVGYLMLISVIVASVVSLWHPCIGIAGFVFALFPLTACIHQYLGTFRRERWSAKAAFVWLLLLAGLAGLQLITALGEAVLAGDLARSWWFFGPILLTLLAVTVGTSYAAWLNLRWSRKLPAELPPETRHQFTLRELFGLMTAVALVAGLSTAMIQSEPSRFGEHVALADAPMTLPDDATDVCYRRGLRSGITMEFTTSEAKFREWVESGIGSIEAQMADVPLLPIDEPMRIIRYNANSASPPGAGEATVTTGLYYEWSHEDRSVRAVFDATTNRAYYDSVYH